MSNNLAEGSGRRTPAGQRYFYDVAHGSVYEVVNILAILKRRDLAGEEEYKRLYERANEIASIIYGLMKATAENEQKPATGSRSLRESPAEYGLPDTPD